MGLRGSSKLLKRTGLAELVRDAMELERRTMELYCRFETVFADPEPVRVFWLDMAEHESRHVGALTLVAGLLESETLRQLPVVPPAARRHVGRLRSLLDDIESELDAGVTLTRAFELTLEIETSEVEDLVLDLLQLLRGAQKRERAARSLIHDLSDLSFMIERYADDPSLLRKADRVIERELRRHESAARARGRDRTGRLGKAAVADRPRSREWRSEDPTPSTAVASVPEHRAGSARRRPAS